MPQRLPQGFNTHTYTGSRPPTAVNIVNLKPKAQLKVLSTCRMERTNTAQGAHNPHYMNCTYRYTWITTRKLHLYIHLYTQNKPYTSSTYQRTVATMANVTHPPKYTDLSRSSLHRRLSSVAAVGPRGKVENKQNTT